MFSQFTKYHSLGNSFILFDEYDGLPFPFAPPSGSGWSTFVSGLCRQHSGIGADGVLIISNNAAENLPEMHVYNADGSLAETCLNGVRCVAHYLYENYLPLPSFPIKSSDRIMFCEIVSAPASQDHIIRTNAGQVFCSKKQVISAESGEFTGYPVSIGNPHFIIFDSGTSIEWLTKWGHTIESHPAFPKKTNVEFVEKKDGRYSVLVYERGCGVTLACGSGAAALTGLLAQQAQIALLQKIWVDMPGGSICSWVDSSNNVYLEAKATPVFRGHIVQGFC